MVIRAIEAIPFVDCDFVCNRALIFVRDGMSLHDKKDIIETIANISRGQRLSVCTHAQTLAFRNFSSDEIIKMIQEIAHMHMWERGNNIMLALPFCESSLNSFYRYGIVRSLVHHTSSQDRLEIATLLGPFFMKIDQAMIEHEIKVKIKKDLINLLMFMAPTQRRLFCERAFRFIRVLAPEDPQNRLILFFVMTLATKPFDEQHDLCELSFSLASTVAKSKKSTDLPFLERASFFMNIFSSIPHFDRSHIHRLLGDFVFVLEPASFEDQMICDFIIEMSKLPFDEREKVIDLTHHISPKSASIEDKMQIIKILGSTSKVTREVACLFATKYGREFRHQMKILSILRFVPKESYDALFLSAFKLSQSDILNDHGVCLFEFLSFFPAHALQQISSQLASLAQDRQFLNAEHLSLEWLQVILEHNPELKISLHDELLERRQKICRSPQAHSLAKFILQNRKFLLMNHDHLLVLDSLETIIHSPHFFFREVYPACEASIELVPVVLHHLTQRFSKDEMEMSNWFLARDLLLPKNIDIVSSDPKLMDLIFKTIFSSHYFSIELIAPRALQSDMCRKSLCDYFKRHLQEISDDHKTVALAWDILSHHQLLSLSLKENDSLAFDALSLCAHKDRSFFMRLIPLISQCHQMISLAERVLTSQLMMISTQEQALMLADSVFDYQEELELDDDSQLCLQAATVKMMITYSPQYKNPYFIFARHQALSLKRMIILNKPLLSFDGKMWRINSEFFKKNLVPFISLEEMLRISGGRRFSSIDLQVIVAGMQQRLLLLSEQDRNDALQRLHHEHETAFPELCNNLLSPYFLELLNHPCQALNALDKSYFCAILSYIYSLSDIASQDEFFTPRECAALTVSESIQNCMVGKEEGITAFYFRLDPQFQYRSSLESEDLPYVAKVKTTCVRLVQQKALDLLSSDNEMMRQMCGLQGDIPQLAHHCLYVKNMIARHIGISHQLRFDPSTELLSDILLSRSPSQLLKIFYHHMNLDSIAKDIKSYVQRLSDEEKSEFFNGVNQMFQNAYALDSLWIVDENTGDYFLSDEGALRVLHEIGCMTVAKQ
jgi:hypothetical protein